MSTDTEPVRLTDLAKNKRKDASAARVRVVRTTSAETDVVLFDALNRTWGDPAR